MEGLGHPAGVDRKATMHLIDSGKLSYNDRHVMHKILTGSIRAQKRLFDAKMVESSMCPCCDLEPETVEHMFWKCPKWHHIRQRHHDFSHDWIERQPACSRLCGIVVEDMNMLDLKRELECEQSQLHEILNMQPPVNRESPMTSTTIAWTDGACRNNQDSRLRRAGSGVFFGDNDSRNVSMILPGREQSNNRAELLAAIMAMHACTDALEIRTDSQVVINGFEALRESITCLPGENRDLWTVAARLFEARNCEVIVTKVKGHATDTDVARGHVLEIDKYGNDKADNLACVGADAHRVPEQIIEEAAMRRSHATSLQRLMIDIVNARFDPG